MKRRIVLTAPGNRDIEIRIVDGGEEINLKDDVEKLQNSSQKNAKALRALNLTINSLKAQIQNFSGYERIIKSLQDQVNRLMMASNPLSKYKLFSANVQNRFKKNIGLW